MGKLNGSQDWTELKYFIKFSVIIKTATRISLKRKVEDCAIGRGITSSNLTFLFWETLCNVGGLFIHSFIDSFTTFNGDLHARHHARCQKSEQTQSPSSKIFLKEFSLVTCALTRPCRGGLIMPILQEKKVRPRAVKWLAGDYTSDSICIVSQGFWLGFRRLSTMTSLGRRASGCRKVEERNLLAKADIPFHTYPGGDFCKEGMCVNAGLF